MGYIDRKFKKPSELIEEAVKHMSEANNNLRKAIGLILRQGGGDLFHDECGKLERTAREINNARFEVQKILATLKNRGW